jgi:hypothetical protein
MTEDEDTPTGDNPVPSPDPADRPRPCKDPWTWRKGAEWKKGHAANPSGVNGSTYRNKAAQAARAPPLSARWIPEHGNDPLRR